MTNVFEEKNKTKGRFILVEMKMSDSLYGRMKEKKKIE